MRFMEVEKELVLDIKGLQKALTISNPNYLYQKDVLGIIPSRIDVQPELQLFQMEPNGNILIPRGAAKDPCIMQYISDWLPPLVFPIDLANKPVWKSEKKLRGYQQLPCDTIMKDDADIIVADCGSGKCIDTSSFIWYNNFIVRIGDIVPLQKGKSKALVGNIISKDLKEEQTSEIYRDNTTVGHKIELDKGYQIIGSSNHPIIGYKDGTIDFIKAKDITNEVYLPVVVGYEKMKSYIPISVPITTYIFNNKLQKYEEDNHFNIQLTSNLSYILGLLVGDGSLKYAAKMGKNQFKFSTTNTELILSIKRLLDNEFSNGTVEYDTRCDWKIKSPELSAILRKLGLTVLSYDKHIPKEILAGGETTISHFLRGIFDTDGSALKNGYIEYCTTSEQLSIDVQQALLALGIISERKYRPNNKAGAYHIYIRHHAILFYSKVGFNLERKQSRSLILDGKVHNINTKWYPPIINQLMISAWNNTKMPKIRKGHLRDKKYHRKRWSNYLCKNKCCPSPDKLKEFIDITNCEKLKELYKEGKVIWLKVKNNIKCKADLYDFVVPKTHSFIANGVINHNTVMGTYILAHSNMPICIIVHLEFLADQWAGEINEFTTLDSNKMIVHDNKKLSKSMDANVVIVKIQSLLNMPYDEYHEFYDRFKLAIFDEVHTLGSMEFNKAISYFGCKRIGLTATPDRTDGFKSFKWSIGIRETQATGNQGVSAKIIGFNTGHGKNVLPEEFNMRTRNGDTANIARLINHLYAIQKVGNDTNINPDYSLHDRTRTIIRMVDRLVREANRHVIVLSHRRIHAEHIFNELNNIQDKILLLGGMKVCNEHHQVVVATFQYIRLAFNMPRLDCLINTGPYTAFNDVKQSTGRILRSAPDKPQPIVIDLFEEDKVNVYNENKGEWILREGICKNMYKKRLTSYRKLEYEIMDTYDNIDSLVYDIIANR